MRRLLGFGCAVSFATVLGAHAQSPVRDFPDDLRAAAQAAVDYANAIPDPFLATSNDIADLLNRPSEQLRTWLENDRSEVAEAKEILAGLKMPISKVKGFDLAFALKQMRADAEANLTTAKTALNAFEGMLSAQQGGDCAAYATQFQVFEPAHKALRSFSTWGDVQSVHTIATRFAGTPPLKPLQSVAPAPASNELRMGYLADDLAALLRCPRPAGAFEIEVKIPLLASAVTYSQIYADVRVTSGLDAAERATVEARLTNFLLPGIQRFTRRTDAKQPMKFRWDGQVLVPVIE